MLTKGNLRSNKIFNVCRSSIRVSLGQLIAGFNFLWVLELLCKLRSIFLVLFKSTTCDYLIVLRNSLNMSAINPSHSRSSINKHALTFTILSRIWKALAERRVSLLANISKAVTVSWKMSCTSFRWKVRQSYKIQ